MPANPRLLPPIFWFHVGDKRILGMSNTADGEEAIRQASTATAGIQTTPVSISFQYYLVLLYKQLTLLYYFLFYHPFTLARPVKSKPAHPFCTH